MIDLGDISFTTQTVVVRGIELEYPAKLSGWTDEVTIEAGKVFVSLDLLFDLTEADNGWGVTPFVIHDGKIKWALECAGLIHVTSRGSVYTDDEQRYVLNNIIAVGYDNG